MNNSLYSTVLRIKLYLLATGMTIVWPNASFGTPEGVLAAATLYYDCNQSSGSTVLDRAGSNNGVMDDTNYTRFVFSSDIGRYCVRKDESTTAGITPAVPPIGNSTYSLSCWAKPTPSTNGFCDQFFIMGGSPVKDYWILRDAIAYRYLINPYPTKLGYFAPNDKWHHYAWVNQDNGDGTAHLKMYVDGVKLFDGILNSDEWNASVAVDQKFLVARPYSAYYYAYIGYICEIALFSGCALTDAEVASLCAETSPYDESDNLNSGLVAHYPFNGNADDETGSGNNGLVYGATSCKDRLGRPNRAFSFDGENDHIIVSNASLTVNQNSSFTISVWAKETGAHPAGWAHVFAWGNGIDDSFEAALSKVVPDNKYVFLVCKHNDTCDQALNDTSISSSEWHHLVGVYSQREMKLFVDGGLESIGSFTLESTGGADLWTINSAHAPFRGEIDDVRIYNRVLSDSEVQQLYVAEGGLNAGLVAYYPFNGNANDESGSGNNGTIIGPILTADRFGSANSAYYFAGYGQRIEVPRSSILEPQQLTVAAWAYPDDMSHWQIILGKRRSTTSDPLNSYILDTSWSTPPLHWRFCTSPNGAQDFVDGPAILTKEWSFVVGTDDQIRRKLYINGMLVGDEPSGGIIPYSSMPLTIGSVATYGEGFKGKIDDVRIYNRALSDTEVMQLYTMSGGGNLVPNPTLSNVSASQRSGTKLVGGTYTLSGAFKAVPVAVMISTNGGTSYTINGPSYPAVAPGNNRSFSWDMSTSLNNKQCSQMRVKVVAGSAMAESQVFPVDTTDASASSRPQIQKLEGKYFNDRKQAFFLTGFPVAEEIKAQVDWKGKSVGTVVFKRGAITLQSSASDTLSYGVGNMFVSERLSVEAISADGQERSSIAYANFSMIPTPPVFQQLAGAGTLFDVISRGEYVEYSIKVGNQLNFWAEDMSSIPQDDAGKDIPGCTGNPLKWDITITVSGSVKSDGSYSVTVSYKKEGDGALNWDMMGHKLNPTIAGGIQGSYDGAQWSLGGHASLKVDYTGETPPVYLWAVPPIYAEAYLGLSLGIAGNLTWHSTDGLQWGLEIPAEVVVGLIAGVGVDSILAVEVFGGGGPYFTLDLKRIELTEYGLKFEYGIRLVMLFYTQEFSAEHYVDLTDVVGGASVTPDENQRDMVTRALNAPLESGFRLMPRNYLSNKNKYAIFRQHDRRISLVSFDGDPGVLMVTADVLQANVYPYSQPDISVSGTNQLMTWIWDNPARSAENRTELVWSKWTAGGWSSPISLWNDGTADFAPSVRILLDGSAFALWQNERTHLTNGATLDEALAGMEIAMAKYDPILGAWAGTNLTDNTTIDHSPQLAAGPNGKALLTWISNASNSPSGSASAPNSVRSRLWDGSAWQDAGNITTNARMLLWSTVAFDGTNGVFLATLDGEDNQSTIDDQELYGAVYSAGAWGEFARWTTNSIQDTKPQAAYDSSGDILVAWYQGSNLVMRAGDLNLAEAEDVGEVGGSSSAKDFRLMTGPAGQISMVWVDMAEDGTGPDPFMINYDFTLEAWSKPIRILNNTNLLERSFAGAYSDDGSLLLAYNQVHIQIDTNGVPIFTNNVVDLMFMDYLIGGDLGLRTEDISLSTNSPQPGQTIQVSALVRNLGELAATNVTVAFYNGNPAGDGVQIGSSQVIPQLAAGANTNISIDWTLPDTVSNQTIYVVVDPGLEQEDRNRANNTASMTAIQPDLVIPEMSVVNSEPEKRLVNARVANEGGLASGQGFDVEFRQGATNGPIVGISAIEAMPAGGIFDANVEWDLSGLIFTSAFETVYALADAGGAVSEGDRDNNMGLVQVMTTLDTDGDGLFDGEESRYGTSPNVPDSDGDGLKDGEEVNTYGTGPLIPDSDGDGAKDGDEVRAGTDPNSEEDVFAITHVDAATGLSAVQWSAKSNKTYQVSRSWELLTWSNAPSGTEPDEQSIQSATIDGLLQYIDIGSSATNRSFYRIDLVE